MLPGRPSTMCAEPGGLNPSWNLELPQPPVLQEQVGELEITCIPKTLFPVNQDTEKGEGNGRGRWEGDG